MHKTTLLSALALASALAFPAAHAADDQDPIEVREGIMKTMGKNMKAMGAMAKGAEPFVAAQFATHAQALAAAAGKDLIAAFPAGSDLGETEAKPEIWENMDDFKARDADMKEKAKALVATSADGDQAAMTAAFGELGKVCKGCHEKYRAD